MDLEFGNLPIQIRRIAYYGLSLEQPAWAKSITHGMPNLLNRAMRTLPTMQYTYKWSNAANDRFSRENLKLYENDK
ncbi:hypothetical protein PUN28_012464 [Cardiocondyla obscurior]|uniref:Cytochrome b-c1 complex subunit 8 n=1 Tax=Cardiocondyla obscurior TaxID=286306 RepID=A0AAW2FBS4_9HYME